MSMNTLNNTKLLSTVPIEIPLDKIGEKYESLRITNPSSESVMFKSMEKYGQLSPIVVCHIEKKNYELLDGFKRLHAARKLKGITALNARSVSLNVHACKASILLLNWVGKISDMEEALVVQSLYHEDGLSQVEIASLLNRHKSWVCRRISLVDRLTDEVQEHIKLGLISVSIGRELAELPRGNQEITLSSIEKHNLTCREAEKLVSVLMSRPESEHDAILRSPKDFINDKPSARELPDPRLSPSGIAVRKKLICMENQCLETAEALSVKGLSNLIESDILCLSSIMGQAIRAAQVAVKRLNDTLSAHNHLKFEKIKNNPKKV